MSRIRDFMQKGVRLVVSETKEGAEVTGEGGREIPPDALAPPEPPPAQPSAVPASVESFAPVYAEAGVEPPAHGYGVDKVSEMLENKRLATLSREVKATAVLTALEAAGVTIEDVIKDAVRRDQTLDAFEAAKRSELEALKTQGAERIQSLEEEIQQFLREKNAEIEGIKKATDTATQAFSGLQLRKQREEERLHAIVAHFVDPIENPVTKAGAESGGGTTSKV
jgi:hypothetical protein